MAAQPRVRAAKGRCDLKLSRWVPAPLRRWRFVLASLDPAERRALLRAVIARDRRDWRAVMRSARTVTFVCHGNIIRSPLGGAALEREAASRRRDVAVESAGLSAKPGTPADPRAIESAAARGLDLSGHRARLLAPAMVSNADLIFVMDYVNLARAWVRFPGDREKFVLLGGCAPGGRVGLGEIRDPVSGTAADVGAAHDEVLRAVRLLSTAWDEPAR